MRRRGSKGLSDLISTLTVAVLFIVILLLVVFSAVSYQSATDAQNANDDKRAVLSFVTTAVHNNGKGEVKPKDFAGAPGLVIEDGDTGFEQRIYMKDGKLLQEYGRSGDMVDPEHALEIGRVKEFAVDYAAEDILRIKTDLGTSYVNIDR